MHERFGLTGNQWTAVEDYLKNYGAMGVAQQRGEWLTKECLRLERTLGDSTKATNESFVNIANLAMKSTKTKRCSG